MIRGQDTAKGSRVPVVAAVLTMLLTGPGWRPAHAQDGQGRGVAVEPPASPPVAQAMRVDEPPAIDGNVLNDPVWQAAEPATGFWQTTPNEGRPSSERTRVHVVYTAETLYFGVICYDTNPAEIIVQDSRRDSSLNDTDSFLIILDTYRDLQNGFVFGTNPSGLEYDGQVVNEGQGTGGGFGGGRQQRGAGGGFNLNWDASWQVRTEIGEQGWTAEFAIPFRTLRYPRGASQVWGLNFQRNIRRRNETSFWAPLTRQFNLYRLSLAGQLRGLEVPSQRNLKITPYVLGQGIHRELSDSTIARGDAGVDLKYSVTPSLTLDATYNTDFAQVEVDEQQINLDRFNLFFPEKRPFFLENAGLFAVGNSGQTEIFFSRRIGVGPEGRAIPILGGVRLSGNVKGYSVGFLNMQTEAIEGLTPGNNFGVVRIRRDLPNRSNIGGIFVNRQATGSLAGDDNYNRSFALDGRWGLTQNNTLEGFVARTVTPGLEGDEHAYDLGWGYESQEWRLNLGYGEVAENFNPEVGFLQRGGFRRANALVFRTFRLGPTRRLHEIRPHLSMNGYWGFDGFHETGFTHIDSHWEWKNGSQIHTGMNLTREGVREPFEIFPGVIVPPGTYDHREAQIVAMSNQSAPLSANLRVFVGGFFGGDRVALSPSVSFRVREVFNGELSLNRNDIDLPGGSFVTNLAILRLAYSFNPRLFVQSLVQYNDRADLWSMNLRFGWLQQANTGLFIVYNDTSGLNDFQSSALGRSLIVKISRLFDVFN